ncbi:hypothetical protein DQ04_15181000 [Trypanosoma grayi]|uniref:hypothetical protein n=1 Tax=Trypanosoma grayi TaxID=71804 RepID=UPI0004F49E75|nr:hypothetical protein DQ04_15181000 [Trypanosoma grayi]KEG06218.1 hypothetical protein DQ04_15181000 [Trypanosoma grayi]
MQYIKAELQRCSGGGSSTIGNNKENRFNSTDGGAEAKAGTASAWQRPLTRHDDDNITTATAVETLLDTPDNHYRFHRDTIDNNSYGSSAALPGSLTEAQPSSRDVTTNNLYAKYLALSSGGKEERPIPPSTNTNTSTNYRNTKGNRNNDNNSNYMNKGINRASSASPSNMVHRAKEDVTNGWALYRQGDREGARRLWNSVHERHADDAVGARARAYIAEAVDRDYESAAAWYDLSLQRDPSDAMTLYNYGVLLEALLGRRREALLLFERAHSLGDSVAGRRAQQLRAVLETS